MTRRAASRPSPSASTSSTARRRAYRGLQHGPARRPGRRHHRRGSGHRALVRQAIPRRGREGRRRRDQRGPRRLGDGAAREDRRGRVRPDRHLRRASTLACAAKATEQFGAIDILVNNAALYYDIDNERNDSEYLQKVFDVNLHGAWLMARACAPTMVEQSWGRIINQSSGAAYMYVIVPAGDSRRARASPTARRSGASSASRSSWPPSWVSTTSRQLHRAGRHDDRGTRRSFPRRSSTCCRR